MKIVNLTPHDITVYASSDVVPAGGKDFVLARRNAEPVYRFPSSGCTKGTAREVAYQNVMGIPVLSTVYRDPEGVPPYKEGVMLIVSSITAQACRNAGRRTDDLLMAARKVRNESGRVIGCVAFAMM